MSCSGEDGSLVCAPVEGSRSTTVGRAIPAAGEAEQAAKKSKR